MFDFGLSLALNPSVTKIEDILLFLTVVTLCSGLLSVTYRRVSPRSSDDLEFSWTIFILTISIGLLVSIIKHAPAVSFGLFGAMSLMRFRAQIKRPARMVFIFMSVTVGVCSGAGEYITTFLGTVILSGLALASHGHQWFQTGSSPAPLAAASAVTSDEAAKTEANASASLPIWGVDFVRVPLSKGERARVLMIADEASGMILAATAEKAFSVWQTIAELDRLCVENPRPRQLIGESWPEFGSKAFIDWSKESGTSFRSVAIATKAQPAVSAACRRLLEHVEAERPCDTLATLRTSLDTWRRAQNANSSKAAVADIAERRPVLDGQSQARDESQRRPVDVPAAAKA
jgi:hypothetical protein